MHHEVDTIKIVFCWHTRWAGESVCLHVFYMCTQYGKKDIISVLSFQAIYLTLEMPFPNSFLTVEPCPNWNLRRAYNYTKLDDNKYKYANTHSHTSNTKFEC